MQSIIIIAIKAYKKLISPYIITSCRHYPTCSEYATEAVQKHGALQGVALSFWRILRCNPFSRGGFDPVPTEKKKG